METLNNQKYIASEILTRILNENSDKYMNDNLFCNAIRLCLGKKPHKNETPFDFLEDQNVANDVY